jgi:hypothetical protein
MQRQIPEESFIFLHQMIKTLTLKRIHTQVKSRSKQQAMDILIVMCLFFAMS